MIRTAGGRFDPTDRPIYFAAGSSYHYPHHVLWAVNDAMTASGERELAHLIDAGHTVLLDSGIFWLTNQHKRATGCTMDEALALAPEDINGFDDLFNRYVYLARRYEDRLWGYIELDQGGAVNKRRTRTRLHDLGLRPIPVYHPLNDGWAYFDELAETHDRMCFGNIVQANQQVRVRLLHTLWERHRLYPDLWVHVLGLTANEWCAPMPPDSCDSSSWLNPLRYPHTRIANSALRTLDDLGPGFLYDRERVYAPDVGRGAACQVYADTVTNRNQTWRDLTTLNQHTLGLPMFPTRLPQEGDPTPWQP